MTNRSSASVGERSAASAVGDVDALAHGLLLAVGLAAAWVPVESHPWTAVVIAGVFLGLVGWGWRRSASRARLILISGAVGVLVLALSATGGWDVAGSVGEVGMVAAIFFAAWLASRRPPSEQVISLFVIGLACLAVWGLAQAAFGLEGLRGELGSLSPEARAYAEERLAGRRAFASLPLPSHLAVLLATALPVLISRVRMTAAGVAWAGCSAVTVAGLMATRSPVGAGLALLAGSAVLVRRRRSQAIGGGLVLAMAVAAVIALRPDMIRLEPVELRLDNWRTAAWLTSTSPISGVGFASFAQASQALPIEVGNRPAHAHGLPFEALAELGPVGLGAVLLLGIALVRSVLGTWRSRPAMVAAVLVVPAHNLVDFSLFVSGVAIPWAVLLGWVLADRTNESERSPEKRFPGRLVCVAVAAIATAATIFHATSTVVEETAAQAPSSAERLDGAIRALRLAPWRVEPQFLLAAAAIDEADPTRVGLARSELERVRWLRPRSAALAERRARLALVEGDVSSALAELWSASVYGSNESSARAAFAELVEAVRQVDRVPPD